MLPPPANQPFWSIADPVLARTLDSRTALGKCGGMDWTLEVVIVSVSDLDGAVAFYN